MICKGSGRPGVPPGGGIGAGGVAEWTAWREGKMLCARCRRFIHHTPRGTLVQHAVLRQQCGVCGGWLPAPPVHSCPNCGTEFDVPGEAGQ